MRRCSVQRGGPSPGLIISRKVACVRLNCKFHYFKNFLGDFNCSLIQQNEILSKRHYLFPFDPITLSGKWIHNYHRYIITYQYIIMAFLLTEQGCQINTESLEKASKNEEGNNF